MRLFAATAFLLTFAAAPLSAQDPGSRLHDLFEEYWDFRLEQNPLMATRVGDHRFNDRLPDVSARAAEGRGEALRAFAERLASIPRESLSRLDQEHAVVLERQLRDEIRELEFRGYLMPITSRSGFHIHFPELGNQVPLRNTRDYDNYVARLRGFLDYTTAHIELMREGLAAGFTLPAIVMEGFRESIEPHIVEDAATSLLYEPFERFPDAVPEEDRGRLREEGRAAILESVVPGYEAFLAFMRDEYVPAGRGSVAIADIPGGAEYYAHLVRHYTTLDEATPEQVHQRGLDEVRRIRSEMQAIIDSVGFEGSFDDFVRFLRTDDRFYVESPEELIRHVAAVSKEIDGQLPRLFKTLPRMPWGIRRVPDFIAPRTTTAYYMRPAGDGSQAGFYYVNTYDLRSRPLYEIEALTLHEAVPGHHLQIALQQEIEDMPAFRRYSGFTAFVEGWALYAERLGLEVGFYQDPYSDFGRLTYEMWRALRLVVDTGMHALGWSRQEAIDFMAENSALTLHNITTEVDRYISWPGQALAYKTGELKIRELRARAERELGDRFDVREFHDVVLLSGAVPLQVLETNVERWIAEQM